MKYREIRIKMKDKKATTATSRTEIMIIPTEEKQKSFNSIKFLVSSLLFILMKHDANSL
jgi:uncharacterized membrane protein